jgi:hypothetical protein
MKSSHVEVSLLLAIISPSHHRLESSRCNLPRKAEYSIFLLQPSRSCLHLVRHVNPLSLDLLLLLLLPLLPSHLLLKHNHHTPKHTNIQKNPVLQWLKRPSTLTLVALVHMHYSLSISLVSSFPSISGFNPLTCIIPQFAIVCRNTQTLCAVQRVAPVSGQGERGVRGGIGAG